MLLKRKCKNPRTRNTKQTRISSTLSQSPLLFCFFSSYHDASFTDAWKQGTLLFILTCNHFTRGDVIFKIQMGAGELIYCHHIIKLSTNIRYFLKLAHICVLIIDSQLYLEWNATQISISARMVWNPDKALIDCHILSWLWNTEEKKWGVDRLPTPEPQTVFLCKTFSKHSILKI